MRRFGLIFVGLLGVWLGGCVAETQTPEGSGVGDTSEESATGEGATSGTSLEADSRMRAGIGGEVGSTQQNLRIDERPPPQPWHDPATPPSPGDGKK
ncbi:MAG: hypothetical protein U0183_13055 [Polyangiaceae bacterium]